ncbi:MAG: discoidin domain-containing protein [Armatimonadota bacterium]|nr:discoidin domain-containing protein [Armatimonadota bacterium]
MMLFVAALAGALLADPAYYRVQATAPVTLTLPARPEAGGHWVRVAGGKWRRVDAERQGDALLFRLDPAEWGAGETILVVGKRPDVVLDDSTAPRVLGVKVEGRAVADAPVVDLGWRDAPPAEIVLGVADASPLAADSLRVSVDGQALPPDSPAVKVTFSDGGRRATLRLLPRSFPGGASAAGARVALRVADLSPQENSLERTFVYQLLTPPAAGKEVEARVDSCFTGYTPDPLVDGAVPEPGKSTTGVTWASEETPQPHWAVVVFSKPRRVEGVELFWAYYQQRYATSRRYVIEYWDGAGWKRAVKAEGIQPAKSTLHRFAPVTTRAVRVWQPKGGGHAERPDILWLAEISLLPGQRPK